MDKLFKNPHKKQMAWGKLYNTRLVRAFTDNDLDGFFKRNAYFENEDVFKERKKSQSNKDVFSRLMRKEQAVFSARGGSSFYDGLTDAQNKQLSATLSDVRDGLSLRKWVQMFANPAYEVDPMGVIFIERDSENPEKVYPTYKSIQTVFDYDADGQNVEEIAFILSNEELKDFGIIDTIPENVPQTIEQKPIYFRYVDSIGDYIYKREGESIKLLDEHTKPHGFGVCPAIVVSDIPVFGDCEKRLSKCDSVVELFEQYQNDRSVRNLSKMLHGFPKAVKPIVNCKHCQGSGYIGENKCSHCGGSGQVEIKNVADAISIPLEQLAGNTSLDIKKIFTYITPDIETWNKQDDSLSHEETLAHDSYYGTDNRKFTSGANLQSDVKETATKTMVNLQPIYARLEQTAEWAETIESKIAYIIGKALYPNLKSVTIKYGRDYILESTAELYEMYLDYKSKGSPIFVLNDYLDRYMRSLYQNNPTELSMALKMIEVEPFVHYTLKECIDLGYPNLDEKRYFSSWYNEQSNEYLLITPAETLRKSLTDFADKIKSNIFVDNSQLTN